MISQIQLGSKNILLLEGAPSTDETIELEVQPDHSRYKEVHELAGQPPSEILVTLETKETEYIGLLRSLGPNWRNGFDKPQTGYVMTLADIKLTSSS
jgi:hypothetical protein